MTERSYNQYCPIAHALDLVGERWALLIVRDLLVGPKRFVDLREGLPGLGTNILTDRLKSLEGAGVIARRYLPPPAASTVYELTERGRELEKSLGELARWGAQTLSAPQAGQVIRSSSVMLAILAVFEVMEKPVNLDEEYEIRCEDEFFSETFGVKMTQAGPEVSIGSATNPVLTIRTSAETLFNLSGGLLSWQQALERGKVQLEGKHKVIARLLNS